MRARSLVASFAVVAVSSIAGSAAAQAPAPAPAAPAKAAADAGPRKDPAGQSGISPYMEQIVKGQAAFAARDFPAAVTAFQDAIKTDPDKMLGFYRLGEAMLESGKLDEADAAWKTALGKKGTDDLQGKVLFCIADLRERQKGWPAAKDAWTAYTGFLSSHPKVKGFPDSAAERHKMIDRRVKDEKDYAVVKERIAAREAERQKEAEENAKKDKLNR